MFIAILLMLLTSSVWKVNAQKYTIKGYCEISNTGTLYIFLTNEQISKRPMRGMQKLIISIDSCTKTRLIEFYFKDIPKGEYGVRCFLDTNRNGKLDFKLFSAQEPVGMSWKNERKSGIPSFDDYSFTLNSDMELKTIKIK